MARSPVLCVVAHPDDETIFFGATIAAAAAKQRVDVVCATSRFGEERMTATRRNEFRRACWMLGARGEMLRFHDTAEPLPVELLTAALGRLVAKRGYAAVYTHGIWGEYGHRHHRDVCLATHRAYQGNVFSLAGPLAHAGPALDDPRQRTKPRQSGRRTRRRDVAVLGVATLATKQRVAATYHSQPFAAAWCSPVEAFVNIPQSCAEALYALGNAHEPRRVALEDKDVRRLARLSLSVLEGEVVPWPEAANIPADVWQPAAHALAQQLRSGLIR